MKNPDPNRGETHPEYFRKVRALLKRKLPFRLDRKARQYVVEFNGEKIRIEARTDYGKFLYALPGPKEGELSVFRKYRTHGVLAVSAHAKSISNPRAWENRVGIAVGQIHLPSKTLWNTDIKVMRDAGARGTGLGSLLDFERYRFASKIGLERIKSKIRPNYYSDEEPGAMKRAIRFADFRGYNKPGESSYRERKITLKKKR